MDASSLASSAIASGAAQVRQGLAIAATKQQFASQQMIADLLAQAAEQLKAATAAGVGGRVDRLA